MGARDFPHWVAMRYGISEWKARRWIGAAHALERLPRLSEALRSGGLGIDKVVELARFANPETEARLIAWARGVSGACIRRKADLAARQDLEEAREAERSRFLRWWYTDEGRRLWLEAELPAAEGAKVVRAVDRLAERVPAMPGEEDESFVDARRADALVLATAGPRDEADPEPERATVVVHAPLGTQSPRSDSTLARAFSRMSRPSPSRLSEIVSGGSSRITLSYVPALRTITPSR